MHRLACVVILVGSALALVGVAASAPASTRVRGRVVRVDRVRPPLAVPRMCVVMSEDQMICIGKPTIDEIVQLFETEGGKLVGQLRIASVKDFLGLRTCAGKPQMIFEVTGSIVAGPTDLFDGERTIVGLRQADVGPSSKLLKNVASPHRIDHRSVAVPPSYPGARRDNHEVELAADLDGDGAADFVLEHYDCPEPGSSAMSPSKCFDTYMERRGKLELVQRDSIHVCT